MINCFQLCSIWSYIKYSNKRRKWQYKNAYGEMQQNKHLMKGSEGRNVFSSILFLENKDSQLKRPIRTWHVQISDLSSYNHTLTRMLGSHVYFSWSWHAMRKHTCPLTPWPLKMWYFHNELVSRNRRINWYKYHTHPSQGHRSQLRLSSRF